MKLYFALLKILKYLFCVLFEKLEYKFANYISGNFLPYFDKILRYPFAFASIASKF